jgi:restriction system protein
VAAFAGSLEGARAKKDVFLMTSAFSKDAIGYVRKIEKRIILIDGEQLAGLMIEHDVGVKVVRTYKVKKIDSDYLDQG